MGHYDAQYERDYEEEHLRKKAKLEKFKVDHPEAFESAMKYKALKDSYDRIKNYL